jgi:hypothetical protein
MPGAVVGIPGDGVDAAIVEAVDDLADPLRRAVDALGDLSIADLAPRKKDDPGVAAA